MRYSDPWCAAFVSAAGEAAGLSAVILPECHCERMIARYRAAGRFEEADDAVPRPGDLIFYDWQDSGAGDCTGESDHVGVVASVTGNLMKVIEGNYSDAVKERTVTLNSRYIRGYAKPDYASLAVSAGGGAQPSGSAGEKEEGESGHGAFATPLGGERERASSAVSLPLLRRGCVSETVRAAQLLLIGRGCRCGPWGADGDFGDATYGAVYRFQRSRRLETDGVIGPQTWTALLGL